MGPGSGLPVHARPRASSLSREVGMTSQLGPSRMIGARPGCKLVTTTVIGQQGYDARKKDREMRTGKRVAGWGS